MCPLLDQRPEIAVQLAQAVAQRRREQEAAPALEQDTETVTPAEQLLERMKDFFTGLREKLSL